MTYELNLLLLAFFPLSYDSLCQFPSAGPRVSQRVTVHTRGPSVCVSAVPSLKKWEGSALDQELTKKTRQTKI